MASKDNHNSDAPQNTPVEDESSVGGEGVVQDSAIDELERLKEENARLRDQALRSLAEVENVRRRAAQERESIVQYANEGLLRELLPIIDDFRRSVDSGVQGRDFDAYYQGIAMINDKIARVLEAIGVRKIATVGEPFNVELHEALMRQPSDASEDTVIGEIEPGYTLGDRVLRHAKVVVSAG